MKKATVAAMLLSLAMWLLPLHVASAFDREIKTEVEFINYQKFHKEPTNEVWPTTPKPIPKVQPSRTKSVRPNTTGGQHYSAPTADKEAVKDLIFRYSAQYGIDPATPLCIAYYESGYNSSSKNKSSSASGVFQYLSGTWAGTDEGKAGLSVYDADANVRAAIKYMASRRSTKPWEVRNKCPKVIPL